MTISADIFDNIILAVDSYKTSHFLQFPPGTEYVYCYVESRGGVWPATVFVGLQAFIRKYLTRPLTKGDVDAAEAIITAHGEPFNRDGWDYIVEQHRGYLPIEIKAVDEGTLVPTHNVLCTIVNTDPKCFWLPNYLETALLRAIWYPTTVATNSFECKRVILRALERTSDDPLGQIDFKLHDFGARGTSSQESAALGGLAHLVNFKGTDTIEGVLGAMCYYDAPVSGFSIPAAEHTTVIGWGREREVDAYRNMLKQFAKPGAIVAVVSDSYDLMHAVDHIWGGTLRADVMKSGATVVVRPDSGDPLTIPVDVTARLIERFGCTINSKGFKVLPSCVRVIQGDGINRQSLPIICQNMIEAGLSLDNLAFGMGGGLLQQVTRDDQKFAMKCSAISIDGVWHGVAKEPITDPGKRSKKGRFSLVKRDGVLTTVPLGSHAPSSDWLFDRFVSGMVINETTFEMMRQRAAAAI